MKMAIVYVNHVSVNDDGTSLIHTRVTDYQLRGHLSLDVAGRKQQCESAAESIFHFNWTIIMQLSNCHHLHVYKN